MRKPKKNTGDNISAENANWKFSGDVVKKFDSHVKKSVPLYEWSHEIGLKISDFFLTEPSLCYDIGCSTGTFLEKIATKNKNKDIKFIGLDEIKDMCEMAKKKNSKIKKIKILNKKIQNYNLNKCDFLTSFYTIQFINPSIRQNIFNKIFKSLRWGGGFLLFEKVRSPDARFQDMMNQIYMEYKIDQSYTPEEILSKSMSLKGVLEPFSTNANIQMMKRAGFKDITTVFKFLNFEGYLAIK
jgi:tRNA (cmo5U34)-methyltransferase